MSILAVSQFAMTAIIGVIAAYIAWRQWTLARDKLALDLYDRRIESYKALREALSQIMQDGRSSDRLMIEFLWKTSETNFLFGEDIKKYNAEFYEKGIRLSYLSKTYDLVVKGEREASLTHDSEIKEQSELLRWFGNQYNAAEAIYGHYLKIDRR